MSFKQLGEYLSKAKNYSFGICFIDLQKKSVKIPVSVT